MKKEIMYGKLMFKSASGDGHVEGYASTFHNIDYGYDKIMPGAFKKTIKEKKGLWPVLAGHDSEKQIGWNREAAEDDHGLAVKFELDIHNNDEALKRHSLAKKASDIGAESGISIGFQIIKWEPGEDEDDKGSTIRYRKIREIRMWEHSMVTFPMNSLAMVTGVKGMDKMLAEGAGAIAILDFFVAQLQKTGLNDFEIKVALETAAAKIETPEKDILHILEQFKNILKT